MTDDQYVLARHICSALHISEPEWRAARRVATILPQPVRNRLRENLFLLEATLKALKAMRQLEPRAEQALREVARPIWGMSAPGFQ